MSDLQNILKNPIKMSTEKKVVPAVQVTGVMKYVFGGTAGWVIKLIPLKLVLT